MLVHVLGPRVSTQAPLVFMPWFNAQYPWLKLLLCKDQRPVSFEQRLLDLHFALVG